MKEIVLKKVPNKTEKEKQLRDYYMYFISDSEGVSQSVINDFKKDVDEVMKENPLYDKVRAENKTVKR